jgi:O-acetyl-ADP-ribose deacetylase (regulator of RNase III)
VEIMRELSVIRAQIGRCPVGGAVATSAGLLPAKFVFHAVGPIYEDGKADEAATLESCYRTCLDMAADRNIETISFPSISTGAYGYPLQEAAHVAITTVLGWLKAHDGRVRVVKLVQFGPGAHRVYCKTAQQIQAHWTKTTAS